MGIDVERMNWLNAYVPGEDKILVHPAINYMLASLDGIVSTGKVFEAKN